MSSSHGIVTALVSLLALVGCSSAPKEITRTTFEADKKKVANSVTSTSGTGVLDDSKKVLVPDFKVYFEMQSNSTATAGDNRVSQEVQLALDPKVMQEITDEIYAQFVTDLKELGYEVVEPAAIAAQNEEFKKYFEGDKMKASPIRLNDKFVQYAPTGWKIDQPGFEIGIPSLGGIFTTNLNDVMGRATKKMEAIRISPAFVVGFANASVERGYNRATAIITQSVSVRPGSAWWVGANGGWGNIRLEKQVGIDGDVGVIENADTAGDKVRGMFSALSYALGGNTNNTYSKVLVADPAKFKAAALEQLKLAQAILTEQARTEKD